MASYFHSAFFRFLTSSLLLSNSCADANFSGLGGSFKNSKPESKPGAAVETAIVYSCSPESAVGRPGKPVDFNLLGFSAASTVTVQDNFGLATIKDATLTYTPPVSAPATRDVVLTINEGTTTRNCTVKIIGDGQVIIPDDGKSRGLKATVYQLSANSKSMAEDFDGKAITPVSGNYLIPNIDFYGVCTGSTATVGPISISTLSDFVITFEGKLNIPADGSYTFLVGADDGAKMWLNGDPNPLLNIDGYERDPATGNPLLNSSGHVYRPASSDTKDKTITLTKGTAAFKLNYWQGPCGGYGAILYWMKPGDKSFSVIPASAFDRP